MNHEAEAAESLLKQANDEIIRLADLLLPKGWTRDDLAKRFSASTPIHDGSQTYYFDGKRVLQLGPVKSEMKLRAGVPVIVLTREVKRYR